MIIYRAKTMAGTEINGSTEETAEELQKRLIAAGAVWISTEEVPSPGPADDGGRPVGTTRPA